MKIRTVKIIGLLMALIVGTTGAGLAQDEESDNWSVPVETIAAIVNADGEQVGLVALGSDGDETGLVLLVSGLEPGDHGVHLHAVGACETADDTTFGAAGGHFNPEEVTHPNHAGDLGNMSVSEAGDGVLFAELGAVTFDDGDWGLFDADGTALVIHEGPDDLATDPSGNSGGRVACAVLSLPMAS